MMYLPPLQSAARDQLLAILRQFSRGDREAILAAVREALNNDLTTIRYALPPGDLAKTWAINLFG
jgi:hypothetical protein